MTKTRISLELLKREDGGKVRVDQAGDVYVYDGMHNLLIIFGSRNSIEEIERMLIAFGFNYGEN